ncbi:uncharacterized protein PFLUO_LOCUS5481 [Penicillium psychrofluorescens]|uniref:uncharacterized protein n=1 Tax=Penicillium psychrofluorescens TaxID=3158075 RepID=UPI003CCD6B6D
MLLGNRSSPNKLTNVVLSNLRQFTNEDQILRIGGLTQDQTTYDPNLKEAIFNYWPPGDTADQPVNSTIGPAFWESFNAVEGVSYIFGLNFYKNDSTWLYNLQSEVNQTLLQVPTDRIHLFELGNENDYSAAGGFRPPTYNQVDYVNEWINKTRHIQVPNVTDTDSLRFFAPSFCCYNVTEPQFFSPWTVWNSTYEYDRDDWIEEVSQHGYVSGVGDNPTLQGTLMNHTEIIISLTSHVELNIFHRENGRVYTMGETNSISGDGSYGVSDVFGSALWLVDYELYVASQNITRIHFHQGTGYRYASWLPVYHDGVGPLVKPPYYGNIFVARFLGTSGTRVENIDLSSDYNSAYAAFENDRLSKLALIDLHEWNPSNGTTRPTTDFVVPANSFKSATVEFLSAPGATYNTSITVADYSYDYGLAQGNPVKVGKSTIKVAPLKGFFTIPLAYSEAALVTFSMKV